MFLCFRISVANMYYSISILFTSCNLLLQMEAHAAKIGLVPSFNIDTHGFDWEQFYFSYFLSNISEYLLQHINGTDGMMETIVAYMRIEMRCSIDPCSPEKLYKTPELYDNLTKPLSHTVFSEISQILKKVDVDWQTYAEPDPDFSKFERVISETM
jgi:hypothetical protein